MILSELQIIQLTGYRQHSRQLRWIADQLKIKAPIRADGLPILTEAQINAAISGSPKVSRINWSKP